MRWWTMTWRKLRTPEPCAYRRRSPRLQPGALSLPQESPTANHVSVDAVITRAASRETKKFVITRRERAKTQARIDVVLADIRRLEARGLDWVGAPAPIARATLRTAMSTANADRDRIVDLLQTQWDAKWRIHHTGGDLLDDRARSERAEPHPRLRSVSET